MPGDDSKKANPLAVRLDAEDLIWLKGERTVRGTPVNALIKTAVRQYRARVEAARKGRGTGGAHTR